MTDEGSPQKQKLPTRFNFRRKMWNYMMKNDLVDFPRNIFQRVPNFKGAAQAAQRLVELDEFKKARAIKINLDKPQEPIRFLALEANKEIIVPIPKLKSGLFKQITPVANATKEQLKTLTSVRDLGHTGKLLGLNSHVKIDLVVLGSVCVSQKGYRFGKGEGFVNLEFALMMRMGMITEDTIVITTVHDCQIVDYLPAELFKEYDVPADIIITPTQTIFVEPRLKKPSGILWHLLSERKLKTLQVLQQLKEMDEKNGEIIVLKKDFTVESNRPFVKNRVKHAKNKKQPIPMKKDISNTENSPVEDTKDKTDKPNLSRRRKSRKMRKRIKKEDNPEMQMENLEKNSRNKMEMPIDFSLKLSNISSKVKVDDLKNALLERGVKPSEVIWQGDRGICYLHFSKQDQTDLDQTVQVHSIMANLQQLCIDEPANDGDENFIHVEPAEPISRIEVIDVTTV